MKNYIDKNGKALKNSNLGRKKTQTIFKLNKTHTHKVDNIPVLLTAFFLNILQQKEFLPLGEQ
jgi:hypothetical protein